jgi:hypothetical protein
VVAVRRAVAVFVVVGLWFVVGSAAVSAQTTAVTIDSRSPALEELDGGGWTTSLGFTNLTDKPITLIAKATNTADLGCSLTLDKPKLPAAQHSALKVTVPAGCKVGEDGIDFTVSAKGGTTSARTFVVTAAPKPDTSKPDWGALWAFPVALVALLCGAAVFFLAWRTAHSPPNQPLKYLEATWSFKDSWVSNVTVAGGLLTGIFGSSNVVTALLGKDAESSVALATVGAAAAVAFIAAGPIVLLATKSKTGDFFTVGGLFAASAVTLTGAFGELWILYRSGQKLDLGGWEDRVVILASVAAVLLAIYAFRTLLAVLKHGLKKPPPGPVSDTIVAAKMIIEALKAPESIDTDKVEEAVDGVAQEYPSIGTSPGDDQPRPRRSALL